jgi:hypothetical protein
VIAAALPVCVFVSHALFTLLLKLDFIVCESQPAILIPHSQDWTKIKTKITKYAPSTHHPSHSPHNHRPPPPVNPTAQIPRLPPPSFTSRPPLPTVSLSLSVEALPSSTTSKSTGMDLALPPLLYHLPLGHNPPLFVGRALFLLEPASSAHSYAVTSTIAIA